MSKEKTKAKLVIMSHLSDAQELVSMPNRGLIVNQLINFAKYLILTTNGDLNMEIDADLMWDKFIN